jgi:hypothetical protein
MRTKDVDWLCDAGILCYGDMLEGRQFNVELYETIMFIRVFNGALLKVQIIYRRMKNDNLIMISELVKDVGESIVANTDYGGKLRETYFKIVGCMVEISIEPESGTLSTTRHSVWMRMFMFYELKKALMPYFKLISQTKKNHDKLKTVCVLIEIPFRQVYCTKSGKICYR